MDKLFRRGGTVPPPFNVIPTPKSIWYVIQWLQRRFCLRSGAAKKEHIKTIRVSINSDKELFSKFSGKKFEVRYIIRHCLVSIFCFPL